MGPEKGRIAFERQGLTLWRNGFAEPLEEYAGRVVDRLRTEALDAFRSSESIEGVHPLVFETEVEFAPGEASTSTRALKAIRVRGQMEVTVTHGSVSSIYEVESRGRFMVISAGSGGIKITAHVVQLPSPEPHELST